MLGWETMSKTVCSRHGLNWQFIKIYLKERMGNDVEWILVLQDGYQNRILWTRCWDKSWLHEKLTASQGISSVCPSLSACFDVLSRMMTKWTVNSDYRFQHMRSSVRQVDTKRQIEGIPLNFVLKTFIRICPQAVILFKIWRKQHKLYMNTYVHLCDWSP